MLAPLLLLVDTEEDRDKLTFLYQNYKQTMYYVAYQILKHEANAEDAVHNAFVRIIQHLDKIDISDSKRTKAFLVVITEHIAIDHYRKNKRESWISYEDVAVYIAENFHVDEQLDEMTEAIIELPVIYSTVLRLKYAQGYTNSEIADILGITEVNVRKRISRGKAKLKEKVLGKESMKSEKDK